MIAAEEAFGKEVHQYLVTNILDGVSIGVKEETPDSPEEAFGELPEEKNF